MSKSLYIAEKPSVAREFARVLHADGKGGNGYLENETTVVTWCVGHLVTMSYPEKYDPKYKKWSLDTLPFFPESYLYELIPASKKQFDVVKRLLEREDVATIYVCTDAGREGEYIYRLVEQMCVPSVAKKDRRRVWIDSQTEEEIERGIREAKPLSAYDNLSSSAYLRAKEDYLMGINFSRLLTVKYGNTITGYLGGKWSAISVGRVMTCVLGMVVRREREIRNFVKMPFYRVQGTFLFEGQPLNAMWQVCETSAFYGSPALYRDSGFLKKEDAEKLIASLTEKGLPEGEILNISRKTEKKYPPLLYNLAEIQNDSSKIYHISPDQTLSIIQELYEKKLVTYPRTDARVLSSAIAKEIHKNLSGLTKFTGSSGIASDILENEAYKTIGKSRYTDDKQVTDHYAIIPTGQGLSAVSSLSGTAKGVYDLIVQRFLSIFYPPAEYKKTSLTLKVGDEAFAATFKTLTKEGYLLVRKAMRGGQEETVEEDLLPENGFTDHLKKGMRMPVKEFLIKEGETTPPKRYTSGSIILAMENAGQLIEDEELREQIRGSGIGTSATRAEILKKLFTIGYLSLNKKTQVITPALLGELVYETVACSLRQMLNPDLTASWEKGLTYVAEGSVTEAEYMEKLENFIAKRVNGVRDLNNTMMLRRNYDAVAKLYGPQDRSGKTGRGNKSGSYRKKSAGKGKEHAGTA